MSPEEKGSLLEGYVFQLIRHEIENTRKYQNIYYWSPAEAKTEVDFLIENEHGYTAIEVKATERLRPDHFNGLRTVAGMKGLNKRIIVYLGTEKRKTEDGIIVLPIYDFAELLSD